MPQRIPATETIKSLRSHLIDLRDSYDTIRTVVVSMRMQGIKEIGVYNQSDMEKAKIKIDTFSNVVKKGFRKALKDSGKIVEDVELEDDDEETEQQNSKPAARSKK